jgi:hypothetical protein
MDNLGTLWRAGRHGLANTLVGRRVRAWLSDQLGPTGLGRSSSTCHYRAIETYEVAKLDLLGAAAVRDGPPPASIAQGRFSAVKALHTTNEEWAAKQTNGGYGLISI